jgi:hypothetical protein
MEVLLGGGNCSGGEKKKGRLVAAKETGAAEGRYRGHALIVERLATGGKPGCPAKIKILLSYQKYSPPESTYHQVVFLL